MELKHISLSHFFFYDNYFRMPVSSINITFHARPRRGIYWENPGKNKKSAVGHWPPTWMHQLYHFFRYLFGKCIFSIFAESSLAERATTSNATENARVNGRSITAAYVVPSSSGSQTLIAYAHTSTFHSMSYEFISCPRQLCSELESRVYSFGYFFFSLFLFFCSTVARSAVNERSIQSRTLFLSVFTTEVFACVWVFKELSFCVKCKRRCLEYFWSERKKEEILSTLFIR